MLKKKFGSHLRSRSETGQANEVLAKCLTHNLCVLAEEALEIGIKLEKANLSTTKDEEWDTEVWITPIEAEVSKECTTISEKREKKERYFGKRKHIEKILEELRR